MGLPKGFIDLKAAYNATDGTFVNIVGVVVDVMPPMPTKGTHHMFTFKLLDERLRDAIYGFAGLPIRFFRDLADMPRVSQHGDVVLLRNIKLSTHQQQPMAISNHQTEVTVFPALSIPEPAFQISVQGTRRLEGLGKPVDVKRKTLEEENYVIQLKQDLSSTLERLPANAPISIERPQPPLTAPTGPAALRKRSGDDLSPIEPKKAKLSSFGNKFKLIHELRHFVYADICAQVVKKFPTQYGSCDLYVTDYTENKEMFFYTPPEAEDERERERDGDTYGYTEPSKRAWPGPYGWLVLKVNAKSPHADYLNREVEEGDFVLLRNVKMKVITTRLEGDMWPDMINREKVQVSKLRNHDLPEIQTILERRTRYWAARDRKAANQQSAKAELTKTEKKKRKKQRAAEQAAAAAGRNEKNEQAAKTAQTNGSKADINPHVRCDHEDVQISTLRYIQDPDNERHLDIKDNFTVPFVCAKYGARVRVVDFAPKQLEDFAVTEPLDDGERSENSVDWESSLRHEWSFSLLLADASSPSAAKAVDRDAMWVHVGHHEAQRLFGNDMDDPVDLQSDPQLLAKLREKLYILWGNLEEKKADETLSNRPFECCLMEYGIEMDDDDPHKASSVFGYQKAFSLFGMRIM